MRIENFSRYLRYIIRYTQSLKAFRVKILSKYARSPILLSFPDFLSYLKPTLSLKPCPLSPSLLAPFHFCFNFLPLATIIIALRHALPPSSSPHLFFLAIIIL